MEFKELTNFSQDLLQLLDKGAFLTTKDGDRKNTMIISWGYIGQMWGKPMATVLVRKSRYTHELLENSKEFTLTFPKSEELKEAWKIAGTKSGKDMDKFETCHIQLKEAKNISTPIIDTKALQMECRVLYSAPMEEANLSEKEKEAFYKDNDYHTVYFSEILNIYETE